MMVTIPTPTTMNPFMAEYARIKNKQIEEIEDSLALVEEPKAEIEIQERK